MAALTDARAREALRLEIAAGLAQASRERDLARRQKLLRQIPDRSGHGGTGF